MRDHFTRRARRIAARIAGASLLVLSVASVSHAGSIFITGHDPDFHATVGYHAAGAIHINQIAIGYIINPAFNPFVATATRRFLFVESRDAIPEGHTRGRDGIVASGYVEGTDFEWHDASTLDAELQLLGSKYAAIVVASDFGGMLTQKELDVLNANTSNIRVFVNAGGGIYAMAESNLGAGLTPNGGQFAYLPSVVSSVPGTEFEIDYTLSSFGESLGLLRSDVNDNVRHCVFAAYAALIPDLQPVDFDTNNNVISLAGRSLITAVEPVTWGGVKALYR
jgi:hypothetical protein